MCVCVLLFLCWRERRQGMKLTGCDGRQFMLLCLNCHLMCMQSGTLTKKTPPLGGRLRWGTKTNNFDLIKPTVRWI